MKKVQIDWSRYGILFAWIALILVFFIAQPKFLSVNNILNILRQVAIVGVCSAGMTFVILTGGMDLSVGSILGLSTVAGALMMSNGVPPLIAMAITLLIGVCSGFLNALFVNIFGIAPIIMTLGTMTALRGVAYIICGGYPVYGIPEKFLFLGQGYVGGIPVPVIIMILAFAAGYFVLNRTTFGRSVYGIGGNVEVARLSGVNVKKTLYIIYMAAGALYALAGSILLARVNSGQPKAGEGYEMDVITACVLGGISIAGGEGRITGVIVGVLMMGTLTNGMIIMNIPEFWQWVVKGTVLIFAVTIDQLVKRGRAAKA
ncbi:MAG: ABC transporter permease [Spirochaetaceae bacterium]|jgi:ribose/xylose/arabinose/galactoside ABC-type transport system permease subunit|nr:ABC transporter permease [Spirochaetaceae bacterium]